jgi:hypothetical protein
LYGYFGQISGVRNVVSFRSDSCSENSIIILFHIPLTVEHVYSRSDEDIIRDTKDYSAHGWKMVKRERGTRSEIRMQEIQKILISPAIRDTDSTLDRTVWYVSELGVGIVEEIEFTKTKLCYSQYEIFEFRHLCHYN